MELKKIDPEQFLFYGHFKTKLFKKERTSLLLDSELLWIRGYDDEDQGFIRKLNNFKMRYLDISSIDIVNNDKFASTTVIIKGKLYKLDKLVNIYVPYLNNADKAISSIREAIEIAIHNDNERYKELENIRRNKLIQRHAVSID